MSVLTPVLNEERFVRDVVASMRRQRFDGEIEFLFADGGSTDRTREILAELAYEDGRIRIFHNEDRTIPAGLNLLLRHARGRYVARMDGHAFYPADYLARAVTRLERGDTAWVSGPQVPIGVDDGSRLVALALSSRLGVGGSRRFAVAMGNGAADRLCDEIELDSGVFCGVWTRSVVEELGGWDEGWPRNQDSEMAGRFLERGLRLVCLPDLGAEYVPRNSLPALARQYAGYGYYRAKTAARHPATLRRSHLLAPAVITALAAAVASPRPLRRLARTATAAYAGVVVAESARIGLREGSTPDAMRLPAVFSTMHGAWGAGFLAGALRFPAARRAVLRKLGLRSGA